MNGLIQFNIGDLLAEQGLYSQALEQYKLAEQLYSQLPTNAEEKQARCFAANGRMFLLMEQQDSAFLCFHKGLELAKITNNNELQSLLTQNLSVAYREAEIYEKAKGYLLQSFALGNDSADFPRYYLNFADLYSKTHQTDSARYYKEKLKQNIDSVDDPYFKASAYNFLAADAKAGGNLSSAFDYQEKYIIQIEAISTKRLEQSVYDVQQKYDYERQQNIYNRALLHRQKLNTLFLALFLLVCLISIGLLRRTLRQKNKMLSLQNAIQTLIKTAEDLRMQQQVAKDSGTQLRNTLLWKFNVQHKSALLKSELQHLEQMDTKKAFAKFDEIVYGKNNPSQWNTLVETIDEINPGLSTFIQQNYPQFSDTELKVFLLSYAGLSAKETALILNHSVHTVNMARTRIRQKMNLTEQGADFCAVLEKKYRFTTQQPKQGS